MTKYHERRLRLGCGSCRDLPHSATTRSANIRCFETPQQSQQVQRRPRRRGPGLLPARTLRHRALRPCDALTGPATGGGWNTASAVGFSALSSCKFCRVLAYDPRARDELAWMFSRQWRRNARKRGGKMMWHAASTLAACRARSLGLPFWAIGA